MIPDLWDSAVFTLMPRREATCLLTQLEHLTFTTAQRIGRPPGPGAMRLHNRLRNSRTKVEASTRHSLNRVNKIVHKMFNSSRIRRSRADAQGDVDTSS